MRTKLDVVRDEKVLTIRVIGPIEGYRAGWQETVDTHITNSAGDVILNLDRATFIGSRGMGYLFALHKSLNAAGRRLLLVVTGTDVRDAFDTAGVTELLRMHESEEMAKAAL